MYKIKIDLSNRNTIETSSEYIYSIKENINDTKNPFITIDNSDGITYIIKKADIVSIKAEKLEEEKQTIFIDSNSLNEGVEF